MYAVIETGGNQYKVEEGSKLLLDRIDVEEGELTELGRVLMIGGEDGKEPRIGTPELPEARVLAEVLQHKKGPKITMMRYKASKNTRTKIGHRQPCTSVLIREIHPE